MSPSIGSVPHAAGAGVGCPGRRAIRAKARLLRLYVALLGRFGPQRWWPGRTPYEVAVGAVLTQHTAWPNAARAVEALARATALDARPGGCARRLRPGRRDPTGRNTPRSRLAGSRR